MTEKNEKSPPLELNPYTLADDTMLADKLRKEKDDAKCEQSSEGAAWRLHKLCNKCRTSCCSVTNLKRRVPIITWLPKYSLADLEGDVVAGITVALTVIPQGLALAGLASLPPQYGLYTAFMGCFAYVIFGSCKDLTIGPTAIMSLMTAEHVHEGGAPYAIMLTFLSGIIQLLMGILNLGFLVDFISGPVISGFTSAAAISIAVTQLKGLFGLKYNTDHFISSIYEFFRNLQHTNYWDMTMGLCCVFLLFIIRHFRDKKFPENSKIPFRIRRILERSWFMLATGRNAVVVIVCACISSELLARDIDVLTLTKQVEPGLPTFALPAFSIDRFDNVTNTTVRTSFIGIVEDLGSGLIIIPLLCILEAIAIAKAFAKGRRLDATQEMIALGMCNLLGSFVGSYPATGSFSRTAINNNSGVRTTLSGVFTGSIVLLALGVMAPYFQYIPNASLSAIIFVAVLFMVHYQDVPLIWRSNKWDLIPLGGTFFGSFILGLEYGILLGVGTSLMILLYQMARPRIIIVHKTTTDAVGYIHIRPDRSVFFPSVEYMKNKINKFLSDYENMRIVVFDGKNITGADYTLALGLKNLIDNYKKEHITTIFINLKPGVFEAIEGTRPASFHFCMSEDELEAVIHACTSRSSVTANGNLESLKVEASPGSNGTVTASVPSTSAGPISCPNAMITTSPLLHSPTASNGIAADHEPIVTAEILDPKC